MSKGWDRASFDFNVRPDKIVRDISQLDLMVPTVVDGGRVKLALLCLASGVLLSLLWVWTTLMLLAIAGHGPGRWFYPIVGCAALAFAVGLYIFSRWDFDRQRRWGREA
jgi:hypothetical protein